MSTLKNNKEAVAQNAQKGPWAIIQGSYLLSQCFIVEGFAGLCRPRQSQHHPPEKLSWVCEALQPLYFLISNGRAQPCYCAKDVRCETVDIQSAMLSLLSNQLHIQGLFNLASQLVVPWQQQW